MYLGDTHNRQGKRKIRGPNIREKDKKDKMNADSVLSMARVFNAGHVPGAALSDLQELSLVRTTLRQYTLVYNCIQ